MELNQHSPDDVQQEDRQRQHDERQNPKAEQHHSWQFWLVFLSLCLLSFASALDGSIITTALPTVARSLGPAASSNYVWIANSFTLTQTAIQPLTAQLCNIFGRRIPMLTAIALFAIGSGVAGGATNVGMVIAGRAVQGLGSGGIYMLVDLIVCDLVSLRDRGKYLGIVLSTAAVGAILGPVVGGGLAEASWRWVFYVNVPIAGLVLVIMWLFLNVTYKKSGWWQIVRRIDWIGNTLFIAAVTSMLLGLIFGGVVAPWSSYRVIVPLVLGIVGWIIFHVFEASSCCYEPSVPPKLFANRTSFIGFVLAFDGAMLLQWTIYFLPIYFQGVKSTSPLTSGVNTLPYNAFLIPAAMVAGGVMSKLGIYRPLYSIGFALIALGVCLFSTLNSSSPTALWVIFQMFTAIGQGFVATTILPAIQAALPESEIASATGMYAFLRSFGFIWGVTVPSLVFNALFNKNAYLISDAAVRDSLTGANAYGSASGAYRTQLPAPVRAEVESVYQLSLKMVWRVAIAFALFGFVISFGSRQLELRKEVAEDFRLQGGKSQRGPHDNAEKLQGAGTTAGDKS
ncbi:MFS general substrate transporter [Zopfia rhizophila CBS 207.26]|uniref:MFS general substrate transporter n=1 Tax=Zopfia rhizophila CBS 207.26 TaxID=1314779 RepID=A0A6A6EBD7_9PEZI|nr:MFS general substrate transporter [Zopfia rhizophila CBS 207.26]